MDLSHMYIDLVPDAGVASYCNATVEVGSANGRGRVALRYDPGHAQELPYLAAHECGHLIRMYSVPPESRLMPVTTPQQHRKAIYDSAMGIERLSRLGMPDFAISEMIDFLHQGIVRQVTNFPADFRIERWLREKYPGLQEFQEPALRRQHVEQLKTIEPEVKEMTSQLMFYATNFMNAAYGRYMARLFQNRQLFTPYRRTEFADRGKTMADGIWDSEDRGYFSDVADAQRWADDLGIGGWFEWRRLDEVQDERLI